MYKILVAEKIKVFCSLKRIYFYHFRIFTLYGGNQSTKWLVPQIIESFKTNFRVNLDHPSKRISLLYLDDFLRILTCFIENKIPSGVYNVCSRESITILEIANIISEAMVDFNLEINVNDTSRIPFNVLGSPYKLMKVLGNDWSHSTFRENINKVLEW